MKKNFWMSTEFLCWTTTGLLLILSYKQLESSMDGDDAVISTEQMALSTSFSSLSLSLDPVIIPIHSSGRPYFANLTTLPLPKSRWEESAYLIRTNYPWKVVLPQPTTTSPNNGKHTSYPLQTTRQQARREHCTVAATNGGPFDAEGWNTGPTVVDGTITRTPNGSLYDTTMVGFGTATTTTTAQKQWILGNYRQILDRYGGDDNVTVEYFCTGFGWLVYGGRVVANNMDNPTGAKRAPRTAIGLDGDGTLMLLVVDGCEKCIHPIGPTLEELAGVMASLGAVYAINMDGGGSSTMVYGKTSSVVNRPTCLDVPFPSCQRRVATVHCIFVPGPAVEV